MDYKLDFSNPFTFLSHDEERGFNVIIKKGELCFVNPFRLVTSSHCSDQILVSSVEKAIGYKQSLPVELPDH